MCIVIAIVISEIEGSWPLYRLGLEQDDLLSMFGPAQMRCIVAVLCGQSVQHVICQHLRSFHGPRL